MKTSPCILLGHPDSRRTCFWPANAKEQRWNWQILAWQLRCKETSRPGLVSAGWNYTPFLFSWFERWSQMVVWTYACWPFLLSSSGFAGTPGYLSPEVLRKEAYGKPVDIWACGKRELHDSALSRWAHRRDAERAPHLVQGSAPHCKAAHKSWGVALKTLIEDKLW